jgi:hypothetical protein
MKKYFLTLVSCITISCVAMLCFGCDSGKGIQKTSDTQNNTDEIVMLVYNYYMVVTQEC